MIHSMTGFARRETTGAFGVLVCEIRSVNHRFLDAGLRLPDSCRSLEPELRRQLAEAFKRGKIDCTLLHRPADAAAQRLQINDDALRQLLQCTAQVATGLPAEVSAPRLDLLDVLRWPGVLADTAIDTEALFQSVRTLFAQAVADLTEARAREGERLAQLILQRCSALGGMLDTLQARLPQVQERIRARFTERLAELGTDVEPGRLEQEVVLILQRLDVAEELDRLRGHIEETQRALKAREPAGRRLDFLMQEFNREANTLSSKSQDLETTRAAVDMKVLIEQMREQVQNLE